MKATDAEEHIFGSDDRPVFRIIIYCLSLAFAVLIASLEALRPSPNGFAFEVTWRTWLTFVIGAAFFVLCFKTIFLSPSKKRRITAMAPVVMTGFAGFLYPIRFVPPEKHGALFLGLGLAVCFLSTIGGMMYAISRFLNADERKGE